MTIGDVSGPHVAGAHWGEEGSLLVSESFGARGLIRLPAAGGPPETIVGLGARQWPSLNRGSCPEARRSCSRLTRQ